MRIVPVAVRNQYAAYLQRKGVSENVLGTSHKWLRFYLDFCCKYQFDANAKGSLGAFLGKLQDKKQTKQQQAAMAVKWYYELGYRALVKSEMEEEQPTPAYRNTYSRQIGRMQQPTGRKAMDTISDSAVEKNRTPFEGSAHLLREETGRFASGSRECTAGHTKKISAVPNTNEGVKTGCSWQKKRIFTSDR